MLLEGERERGARQVVPPPHPTPPTPGVTVYTGRVVGGGGAREHAHRCCVKQTQSVKS